MVDAEDDEGAGGVLERGDGDVGHVDVLHLKRSQVQADAEEFVALVVDCARAAGVERPRGQAQRVRRVLFRVLLDLGEGDVARNLGDARDGQLAERHERRIELHAVELERRGIGADGDVEKKAVLDALGPDEAALVRLGIHASRARHFDELGVGVDERGGSDITAREGLEGDGRGDHDGVGA